MRRTPLDGWAEQICGSMPMEEWQLARLRETLALAKKSGFYTRHLQDAGQVRTLKDLQRLPFTTAGDIIREGMQMLCVPPGDISRIVTLRTSGTTDAPKRIYFTEHDIGLTARFFAGGLPTVTPAGSTMAVMMPCKTPDGVGDLICRGLSRASIIPVPYGPLVRFADAAHMLVESGARAAVGFPVQILALARYLAMKGVKTKLRSVLLSGDNVPEAAVRALEEYGIQVYRHLGMTETGLGFAIDCDAHEGMHIREPDLLVEIADPATGQSLPDGERGEIVVTTLTRCGMPLIRYRTGDYSRILPGRCRCGSMLRRLDDVRGRVSGELCLKGRMLMMHELDEVLFCLPQIMDFCAAGGKEGLLVRIAAFEGTGLSEDRVRAALMEIPAIRDASGLRIEISIGHYREFLPLHEGKRKFYLGM